MDSFWEISPLIVFLVVMAFIAKIILDNMTKRKLIEKGMLDENVKYLYAQKPESHVLSSLKWGMILIGIGVAIFIGQLVPEELTNEVTIGGMFVLAGLGLVIYHVIAGKMVKKSQDKSSEI